MLRHLVANGAPQNPQVDEPTAYYAEKVVENGHRPPSRQGFRSDDPFAAYAEDFLLHERFEDNSEVSTATPPSFQILTFLRTDLITLSLPFLTRTFVSMIATAVSSAKVTGNPMKSRNTIPTSHPSSSPPTSPSPTSRTPHDKLTKIRRSCSSTQPRASCSFALIHSSGTTLLV